MSFIVHINWKTVCAIGASICGIIACIKMSSDSLERVSVKALEAVKR